MTNAMIQCEESFKALHMAAKDKRVDTFIENAQAFAKPILKHLRTLVHKACPEAQETIKWGMPHFEYRGKILCSMAAFKAHCAFGFRWGALMKDAKGLIEQANKSGMGHFGKIKSLDDLPADKILVEYIREAMLLNEQGVTKPKATETARPELTVPDYFAQALRKDTKAQVTFVALSYSHRKEYLEWITSAKTEATRSRRVATAVEWLHEGKGMNWKYEKKKM